MSLVNKLKLDSLVNFLVNILLESGIPFKAWQRKLKAFEGIHKGRACILIGNGPSVRLSDLEKINRLNSVKFVFNRFHKIYPSLDFYPDYTMSIDPLFIEDFIDELSKNHRGHLFLGHHRELSHSVNFSWFKIKSAGKYEFSNDPIKYTVPGGSVVVAALQIAYYMGCREFYLYGVDHKFLGCTIKNNPNGSELVEGDGNHFIKNYRSGKAWHPPDMLLIEKAFLDSKMFIESNGGSLKNMSRYSQLEVIDKVDCNKVFEKLSNQL